MLWWAMGPAVAQSGVSALERRTNGLLLRNEQWEWSTRICTAVGAVQVGAANNTVIPSS